MKTKSNEFIVTDEGTVLMQFDRLRELRFSHKAIKQFSAKTGAKLNNMDAALQDPAKIEILCYVMLRQDAEEDGEKLTQEKTADLMDKVRYGLLIKALGAAAEAAFDDGGGQEDEGSEAESSADEDGEDRVNPTGAAGTGETASPLPHDLACRFLTGSE